MHLPMHTVFDKRQKVLLLLRSFEVVVCDLSRFGVVARFVVLCRVVESTTNLLFGLRRSRTIGRGMLLIQKLSTKSRALQVVFSNANEKPSTSKNNLENDNGDEEDWDSSSNAHEVENNDHSFIGEGDEDDNNDNDGDISGEKHEHNNDNDIVGGDIYQIPEALDRGDQILSINGKLRPKQLKTIDDARQLVDSKLKLNLLVLRPSKTDPGYVSVMGNA
ncbi:hypothetical protein FRACYDRAFT_247720 [Fragilariopsis cylindrus CCMP1102]|uniref:PDZ domain-containing protein n=1 Tax=Fragilariopsis cylindrus CCMP1102 TaxID=635003 RepID=A0A1E7EW65_9STRA|nr:hypothetical protein FRACYDRAFT_247720 [Fragilariopsis cylindrus CCMP1102]|eukprot:OEU10106.1 hypothetical protein FRACYDRAFT_247720 [Fragilariopsis cylindrus CCMP1102]